MCGGNREPPGPASILSRAQPEPQGRAVSFLEARLPMRPASRHPRHREARAFAEVTVNTELKRGNDFRSTRPAEHGAHRCGARRTRPPRTLRVLESDLNSHFAPARPPAPSEVLTFRGGSQRLTRIRAEPVGASWFGTPPDDRRSGSASSDFPTDRLPPNPSRAPSSNSSGESQEVPA
jgi:hypothetical protein